MIGVFVLNVHHLALFHIEGHAPVSGPSAKLIKCLLELLSVLIITDDLAHLMDSRFDGQERCRIGGMQDRRHAGQKGCRTGRMQER